MQARALQRLPRQGLGDRPGQGRLRARLCEPAEGSPFFGNANKAGALELGTQGTEFHPDLEADLADVVVIKPRVSAFYCTDLEPLLRANKVERLALAGVSTAWAVQATARDAHDRDYQVVIVEDACAAASEEEHQASMKLLSQIAKVVEVEDLASL